MKTTRAQLEAAVRDLLARGWSVNAVASDRFNPVCFYCGESVFQEEKHRKTVVPDVASRSGYREIECPLTTVRGLLLDERDNR